MSKDPFRGYYLRRDAVSGAICVVACALLLDLPWLQGGAGRVAHALMGALLCYGVWLDWRSGLLGLKLDAIPEEVRRRGLWAFGWVRPLSLASLVLFSVATWALPPFR